MVFTKTSHIITPNASETAGLRLGADADPVWNVQPGA